MRLNKQLTLVTIVLKKTPIQINFETFWKTREYIENNTWSRRDMEFIFECSHSISHSFAALTRSISMWTLEDKFHISKQ